MRNIYTSEDGYFVINAFDDGSFEFVIYPSAPSEGMSGYTLEMEEARKAFRAAEKEFLGGLG